MFLDAMMDINVRVQIQSYVLWNTICGSEQVNRPDAIHRAI